MVWPGGVGLSLGQYGAPGLAGAVGVGGTDGAGGGVLRFPAGSLRAGASLAGLSAGGVSEANWVGTDWQPERTNVHISAAVAQRATRHRLNAGGRFAPWAVSA